MKRIGIVGLGEMGLPMAGSLIRRGFDVRGYDIRPEALRAWQRAGGTAVGSVASAAEEADAVIVMVRTPPQASSVVLDEEGILDRARRDAVVIVMSTVGVACMRRLGEAARARGLGFLDAPVSGGRARAEEGGLTVIVGGDAADLARARPVLEGVGSRIEHVGGVGAGTAVKMANQVLLTVGLLAAREMAALVDASGIAPEAAWDVIRTCTGTTWVIEHWPFVREWIEAYRPGTSLDILVKDTGLALDSAREAGVPAPMLGLASQLIVALTRRLAASRSLNDAG